MSSRKILYFVLLSFGLSWTIALVWWLATDGSDIASPGYTIMALVYMFMPMVSAIVVQRGIFDLKVKKPFGVNFRWNRWWWIAWLSPVVLVFAAVGISLIFPEVTYTPDLSGLFERLEGVLPPEQLAELEAVEYPMNPVLLTLIQGLVAGITVNAIAAFGEELGWRGLMHESLAGASFWRGSFVIGVIWGLWHAPLILMGHNYPGYPVIGVLMMVTWCVLLSPLFSLVRIRSGSVIAASIMHGTLNGTGGLSLMMVSGGGVLLTGITGLAGFIVLVLLNVIIWRMNPEPFPVYETEQVIGNR